MIGRARGITPEWVQREKLANCSRDARLLFFFLATIADDHGRAPGSPAILAGQFFYGAHDADARELVPGWLIELERAGEIATYRARGQTYLRITAWAELVRPDRFGGRQYPPPPGPPEGTQAQLPFHEPRAPLRVVTNAP